MQGAGKVGGLVIVFVLLVIGAYQILGRQLFGSDTHVYYADFADAGGINEGAKVLMAGVNIGSVTKIALVNPRKARITLTLDKKYRLPVGSQAIVPPSLIGLGDTQLWISPPETTTGYLPPESVIPGMRPGPLDAIMPNSKETLKELNATLTATRKLLENGQLQSNLNALMKSSSITAEKFGRLADQTNLLLSRNQGDIARAIHSAANAMHDVQQSTALFAKLMKEGKLQKDSEQLLESITHTAQKAQGLVVDLDRFVNDPSLRKPLSSTMSNISDMTASGAVIAKNTEQITANGAIVSKKAIDLADKAGQIEDEAREALKHVSGFFSKPTTKATPIKFSMDFIRSSKPDHWRTDLNGELNLFDNNLSLGLYDAFEGNRFSGQLIKNFSGAGRYRYGVYASKPGLGVDYQLTRKLGLRGDLFDLNDPQFNVRASYQLNDDFVGWLGMERIFGRNAPAIGFGVHK
jgi:phospholipid/cholesterol/gamma-HCH transport system substrate-binding protein